ncbi:MAG TPA: hypothetical protein VG898_10170 [Solirubrobacterales bacterium]|nr:hypothetical protein [Solirubrobacterales bacterium]
MSAAPPGAGAEMRLAPESIEEIACRIAELLRDSAEPPGPKRLISAAEVAELWGVERDWVYENADQLGARRLGAGKRPRLRFDPAEVEERIAALAGPAGAVSGRSGAMPGDARNDSISRPSGAIVGERKQMAGRRSRRPRPGAEG